MKRFFVISLLALAAFAACSLQEERAQVIDGDTIQFKGERWRLWGIDAPEINQTCRYFYGAEYPCGEKAAQALADLVEGKAIVCERVEIDRYGRSVGVCRAGDIELGGELVLEGWAIDNERYSARAYAYEQKKAREAQRGIWNGTFQQPIEFRLRGPGR